MVVTHWILFVLPFAFHLGQPERVVEKAEARSQVSFQMVNSMPADPPSARISYGPNALQFAELRLSEGDGPWPVAIVIHGGCWLSKYADLNYTRPMASALCKRGFATWNIEYRRADNDGGGWPETFLDVARAADHLREIAGAQRLYLNRVITVGHSAGGHLAAWLAARHRLKTESPLYSGDPLKIHAVVSLAGIGDLGAFVSEDPESCGFGVFKLLGGKPDEVPDR